VRSLLAAGLERVLVVVGHDAGPVATVVGRLGRDQVGVVYADRWADGNGASPAAVQGDVLGEALFVLVTADHVFGEGGLLVQASSVADGVDGEVARLQLRGGPRGALLDGVLDRVGDAAILVGLGLWALDGHDAQVVLVLTVAATTGALLSMASKDRAAALGLPPAPERALGWLLGGRDGRLLLVAVGAVVGAPVAALAAITATSALSLGLRVAFLRRPPAPNVGDWS
jgi:phosphatidylglycerophosphate synthase